MPQNALRALSRGIVHFVEAGYAGSVDDKAKLTGISVVLSLLRLWVQ